MTSQRDRKRESFFAQRRLLVTANYLLLYWQLDFVCPRVCASNLFLQVRLSKGEQEFLDVFRAQTVDAARVDGPAQKLIHLVLWV